MKGSRQKAEKGTLKKVFVYLKPYWPFVLLSILFSAVTVALTLYVPVLIGRAIDGIIGPGQVDFAAILKYLSLIAGIVGLSAIAQWVLSASNHHITSMI